MVAVDLSRKDMKKCDYEVAWVICGFMASAYFGPGGLWVVDEGLPRPALTNQNYTHRVAISYTTPTAWGLVCRMAMGRMMPVTGISYAK